MARRQIAVDVDDVFVNVARPRREWRVTQRDGDTVTLERIDPPGALRFITVDELLDSSRYLPKGHEADPRTEE